MDTRRKTCFACSRQILLGEKYCIYHNQAFDSLKEQHKAWHYAYGEISWNDFLNKLLKMNETGSWVKEVIAVELNGIKKRGLN